MKTLFSVSVYTSSSKYRVFWRSYSIEAYDEKQARKLAVKAAKNFLGAKKPRVKVMRAWS